MKLSHVLQSAAAAAVIGLGILGTTTPALADHVRTRCDNDGDTCWRVWCDHDWDDCHPVPGSIYHRYGYYRRYHSYGGYYGSSSYGGGYYGGYYSQRHRVCDWDGDDCHWSTSHYDDNNNDDD